MIVRIVINNWS